MKKEKGNKKGINIKKYLREFLLFVDKNLMKKTIILAVISILLVAIALKPMTDSALTNSCEGTCSDSITIFSDYTSKLQILLITAVAGIVPYIYISALGFVGYVLSETNTIAYMIKGHGFILGIGMGIIPLLLNIIAISIITALGIYICKTITVGYKISGIKNMNFTNFKIRLYETMRKEDKVTELTNKKNAKIEELETKKEKIKYLQILNTAIVVCVIQFLSVLIQNIML